MKIDIDTAVSRISNVKCFFKSIFVESFAISKSTKNNVSILKYILELTRYIIQLK